MKSLYHTLNTLKKELSKNKNEKHKKINIFFDLYIDEKYQYIHFSEDDTENILYVSYTTTEKSHLKINFKIDEKSNIIIETLKKEYISKTQPNNKCKFFHKIESIMNKDFQKMKNQQQHINVIIKEIHNNQQNILKLIKDIEIIEKYIFKEENKKILKEIDIIFPNHNIKEAEKILNEKCIQHKTNNFSFSFYTRVLIKEGLICGTNHVEIREQNSNNTEYYLNGLKITRKDLIVKLTESFSFKGNFVKNYEDLNKLGFNMIDLLPNKELYDLLNKEMTQLTLNNF